MRSKTYDFGQIFTFLEHDIRLKLDLRKLSKQVQEFY